MKKFTKCMLSGCHFRNIAGAIAFILGVVALVLGFLLFTHLGKNGSANKISLVSFFSLVLVDKVMWLGYLWSLGDFFVRCMYGLEAICSAALLTHFIWTLKSRL